ncbi:hypothetical protein MTR67_025163 [Solanum verrucosum]|uniref:Uncharacterized protein n=1 Tax=Solanum verrucosum TaxID=315347 RepID=A0AAF0TZA0_SOLVR|nr:hypothetical protein MTR67_025163 [Solanum verrucosum]
MASSYFYVCTIISIILYVSATAAADSIQGCGGFVEASSELIKSRKSSDPKLDYSNIIVELRTLDGLVKERTHCAPNGYYFIPVYDKVLLPDVAKYGELNPWCTEITSEPYGVVGLWRTIRNLWSQMEGNMYIKVGNGNKTKFWKDGWIDQTSLRELFPDLFLIWENLDAKVSGCWTKQGWDISLRRLLNDREVERVAALRGKLGGMIITITTTNKILWKHSKDELFSVNNAYKRGLHGMTGGPKYNWNYFWKSDIPTKVKCFTWFTVSGRIVGNVGGESCALKDGGPSNVNVELLSPTGDVVSSALSTPRGTYSFTNTIPGKYKLRASRHDLNVQVRGSAEIDLGFENRILEDFFFVPGYDIRGSVVAQGNPILGVHIYLYSDDVTKVDCPKGSKNSPGDLRLGEALCHNVTDANGIFSLKSIPCGKTFIFAGVILLIWLYLFLTLDLRAANASHYYHFDKRE